MNLYTCIDRKTLERMSYDDLTDCRFRFSLNYIDMVWALLHGEKTFWLEKGEYTSDESFIEFVGYMRYLEEKAKEPIKTIEEELEDESGLMPPPPPPSH